MDDLEMMREGIAKQRGITMFDTYGEAQAAAFLRIDVTTLKRMRRAGKVPARQHGPRKIYYIGIDIVDLIIGGDKWRDIQKENSE